MRLPAEITLSLRESDGSVGVHFQVRHRVVHGRHIKVDDPCAVVQWSITDGENIPKGETFDLEKKKTTERKNSLTHYNYVQLS